MVWNGGMFGDSRKGVVAVDIRRPTLALGVCLSTQRIEGEEHTVWAEAPQGVLLNMGEGQLYVGHPTSQLNFT